MLAKTFVRINSNVNLSEDRWRRREETRKKNNVEFDGGKRLTIEMTFTLFELECAMERTKITSPGKDNINYEVLKHLGDKMQATLLGIYNNIWERGHLPKHWKEAIIIPIIKPRKDPSNPSNPGTDFSYREINGKNDYR